MPTKRVILSELIRDELRDNLDVFELVVDDRRVTSQLIACSSRPWRLAARTAAILYSSRLTNWRRQREAGALYQHEVPHGCR